MDDIEADNSATISISSEVKELIVRSRRATDEIRATLQKIKATRNDLRVTWSRIRATRHEIIDTLGKIRMTRAGSNHHALRPEPGTLRREMTNGSGDQHGATAKGGPSGLTSREMAVLRLIASSYSTKAIAFELQIGHKTVVNHRTRLMKKLGIHEVAGLTRFAIQSGLISATADVETNDPTAAQIRMQVRNNRAQA